MDNVPKGLPAEIKVKAGYKKTEAGLIPNDWDVKKLDDLVHFNNGKAHEQYIIANGNYIVVNSKFISTEGEVCKTSSKNLSPLFDGEITMVMSDIPNGKALAKCFFIRTNNRYTLNQRICSFKSKSADSEYLFYKLNRNKYFLDFDSGVGQTNLRRSDILNCPVVIPKEKSEQSAIATTLSDIDSLIASLEKLIEKKKLIKQGVMQELLTGKRRLKGFSGEWRKVKLKDVLSYEQPTKYIVKSSKYQTKGKYPVLTAGKTFILGYTNEIDGIFTEIPVIIFDDFTTASKYVDFCFKVKSSAMKMLKPRSKNIDLRFIYEKMQLIDFVLGDHKRYWISEYSEIEVDIPEYNEQIAIANILSDLDLEIEKLKTKHSKLKVIKDGAMQQLLTGKIRIN